MKELRSKLIKETMDYFNHESNEPSPTFNMNLVKGKIQKSVDGVENEKDVYDYLSEFKKKIGNMNPKYRKALTKVVIASLIMVTSLTTVKNVIGDTVEDNLEKPLTIKKSDMLQTNLKPKPKEKVNKVVEKKFIIPSDVGPNFVTNLKREEGSAKHKGEPLLKPYKLKDGKITIGWGHAEPLRSSKYKMGDTITREEAESLLKKDIFDAKDTIDDVFADWKEKGIEYHITQNMYDAMVSMAFNMGRSGFRNTKFIQLVKKGKYEEARDIIPKTNVTFKGHVPRRQNEKNLFGKGMPKLRDSLSMSESKSNYVKNRLRGSNFKYKLIKNGDIHVTHELNESFSFQFNMETPTNKTIKKLGDRVGISETYYQFYNSNLDKQLLHLLKNGN